jgi:4-hydroxythreonine-4-phosphate dehydrogenase
VKRPYRIAITTGDIDGIGLEISCKALSKLGPKKDFQFIVFRSPKSSKKDLSRLDSSFKRVTISSWHEALTRTPGSYKELLDINSSLSPATWVETAAQAASHGHVDGIATAPISKTVIHESGMNDIGHTDILKRVSGTKEVFMGFIGSKLSVVLATGHIPLAQVPQELTSSKLETAITAAFKLRTLLSKKIAARPVGVLGLNPHAGENSIIGTDEATLHVPVIESLKKKKLAVEGPLVPDTSFYDEVLEKYSVLVACYHDQGLIPFKSLHKNDANVHITLGLPFIRTSVDHGTAKDIFGKNKADPNSMQKAIELAIELCRGSVHV